MTVTRLHPPTLPPSPSGAPRVKLVKLKTFQRENSGVFLKVELENNTLLTFNENEGNLYPCAVNPSTGELLDDSDPQVADSLTWLWDLSIQLNDIETAHGLDYLHLWAFAAGIHVWHDDTEH